MGTKRVFDIVLSLIALITLSPLLLIGMLLVWAQDKHSPFYAAPRVGKDGKQFTMLKLRSMVIRADQSGVDSTSNNDQRITRIGRLIRKYKLDEIPQLINVLLGDMSLVGPRPNVRRETEQYTSEEQLLLSVKPGITDISSIVFSDEGSILEGSADPDLDYNRLIRPWKSRLGILYVQRQSVILDIKLLFLTVVAVLTRESALVGVQAVLTQLNADPLLIEIAARKTPLLPYPPPGASQVVASRAASK